MDLSKSHGAIPLINPDLPEFKEAPLTNNPDSTDTVAPVDTLRKLVNAPQLQWDNALKENYPSCFISARGLQLAIDVIGELTPREIAGHMCTMCLYRFLLKREKTQKQ